MMWSLPPVDSQSLVPPQLGVLFWPFSLRGPLKTMADARMSPSWSKCQGRSSEGWTNERQDNQDGHFLSWQPEPAARHSQATKPAPRYSPNWQGSSD